MRSLAKNWFAPLVAILLSLPLLANMLLPAPPEVSVTEDRRIAPLPGWPKRWRDAGNLGFQFDAYARDHFGLRNILIDLYASLVPGDLRPSNRSVLIGLDGWMFLQGDNMIEQSRGELVRSGDVGRTADLVTRVHAKLHATGIRFLFAPAPNSATIYPDKLQKWARNTGGPTEYDLLLDQLASRHVPTLDLREALRAARAASDDDLYFHQDTHWSPHGAIAAFNAIAVRMGHDDWPFDAEAALGAPVPRADGDLVRLSRDPNRPPEIVRPLTLPAPEIDLAEPNHPFSTYRTRTAKPSGTRLLIIGDSFSLSRFLPLDSARAAQVGWTYYNRCSFDWSMIDLFKPDEVWLMPTERQMLCAPGAQPKGLPRD